LADQASSSITIDASPEEVLAVIRDVEQYPTWTNGISQVVVAEAGVDGPAKATFTMSQSGLSDEYTLNYSWASDGVSWTLAAPSKLQKSQHGSYRLSPDGGGTKVLYLLTMDIKMPMIGLMKRKAEKIIIDTALKELKKRVESLR
jgi:ribosome-associated toxin RatA of RatAB toxin-antitoxin module